LESAAHAGLVKGGDERLARRGDEEFGWDAETFARECVANAASQSVPFVEAARRVFFSLRQVTTGGGISEHAYAYSVAEAAEAFVALDRRLASRLVGNAVAARASAATGAALLRAALVAFGKPTTRTTNDSSQDEDESSFFSEGLTEALRRAKGVVTRSEKERGTRLPGAHLAVVFGAVAGSAGFSAKHAARMFCYLTLRDTLSAATRLNLLGPLAAGAAMRRCAASANACAVEAVDACVRAAEREEAYSRTLSRGSSTQKNHAARRERAVLLAMTSRAASSAPLVDIVHAGHDALFARLFNS
jgi:urease accessory protein UreF